jgi:erythronate-4-phosphate dehydrogenase
VITLLADRHIPWLDELLPEGVRLVRYDPQHGFGEQAADADALFVRTVTQVNALSLSDAGFRRLRFVATASAGVDHVDRAYLAGRGVVFASAAGSNARAVAEYVSAGVLDWHLERGIGLAGRRLGVVGAGNTGSAVAGLLGRLGMQVVLHDPPRAKRETDGGVPGVGREDTGFDRGQAPRAKREADGDAEVADSEFRYSAGFVSSTVEEVLDVDVLSFHVPLVARVDNLDGFPVTHNWLGADRLQACRAQLVVNAARGGVVDEGALGVARRQRGVDFIGDVWMGEPAADCDAVLGAWLATPHIAGYSVQAKWNATAWIVRDFCRFFGIERRKSDPAGASEIKTENGIRTGNSRSNSKQSSQISKQKDSENISSSPTSSLQYAEFDVNTALSITDSSQRLRHILHQTHPMFRYSKILKQAASEGPSSLRETFLRLRTKEPLRNEYLHAGFPLELQLLHPELATLS